MFSSARRCEDANVPARRPGQLSQRRTAVLLATVFLAASAVLGQDEQRGFQQLPEQDHPQYQNGGYFALVIGIQNYSAPLSSLTTPIRDAQEVASLLSEQYGFQVEILLDRNATRNNILSALDRYRNTLRSTDSLLIYFAGHGYYDHDADRAYWLPADADSPGSPNHISADDISAAVRVLESMHVLVVSDSCYSGDLTRGASEEVHTMGRPEIIERMLRSRSRNLMTSGGDEPVADGGPDGHSVFAYAFLRALKEEQDEAFTATDLFYGPVQQEVAGSSRQTPRYSILRNSNHEYGDFVFLRKSRAAASSSTPAEAPFVAQRVEPPPQNVAMPVAAGVGASVPGSTSSSLAQPSAGLNVRADIPADSGANVPRPVGAPASALISSNGFDPFTGAEYGIAGKIILHWNESGTRAEVRADRGKLYFFDRGPAVNAKGQPVGPVSCDGLRFFSSAVNAHDASRATIPNVVFIKISSRSGMALLYLPLAELDEFETDLRRLCSSTSE